MGVRHLGQSDLRENNMTLTITEEGTLDLPVSLMAGTAKRRKIVYLRGTSTDKADTWSVGTACPDAADIEGILWANVAGVAGTANNGVRWSGITITLAGSTGVYELGVIVNLT
jgi:hypothetical protein